MNVLNIWRLMRLRKEAARAQDWAAELHYGAMALAGGFAWGVVMSSAALAGLFILYR